jgi:hypothetical protein
MVNNDNGNTTAGSEDVGDVKSASTHSNQGGGDDDDPEPLFESLDDALEWVEERLLRTASSSLSSPVKSKTGGFTAAAAAAITAASTVEESSSAAAKGSTLMYSPIKNKDSKKKTTQQNEGEKISGDLEEANKEVSGCGGSGDAAVATSDIYGLSRHPDYYKEVQVELAVGVVVLPLFSLFFSIIF